MGFCMMFIVSCLNCFDSTSGTLTPCTAESVCESRSSHRKSLTPDSHLGDASTTGTTSNNEDVDDTKAVSLPTNGGRSDYERMKERNIARNMQLLKEILSATPIMDAGGVSAYLSGDGLGAAMMEKGADIRYALILVCLFCDQSSCSPVRSTTSNNSSTKENVVAAVPTPSVPNAPTQSPNLRYVIHSYHRWVIST